MSRRTDSPRSRSSASSPRARVAVLALIAGLCAAPAALAHPPYAGRTLDDALHELAAAGGLQLVYTAELVPPGATVAREPSAGPPLEAIAQVLEPAGLALERIDDRTFAIRFKEKIGPFREMVSNPINPLFVMREADAKTDPNTQVTTTVGSGPFVFVKD